jgi:hypothetical protein
MIASVPILRTRPPLKVRDSTEVVFALLFAVCVLVALLLLTG